MTNLRGDTTALSKGLALARKRMMEFEMSKKSMKPEIVPMPDILKRALATEPVDAGDCQQHDVLPGVTDAGEPEQLAAPPLATRLELLDALTDLQNLIRANAPDCGAKDACLHHLADARNKLHAIFGE